MKIAFFDTHNYDRTIFAQVNGQFGHEITYFEPRLTTESAVLAAGHDVVCSFVNDKLDEDALVILKKNGVRLIALRSAGFNHVDLQVATRLGLPVVRVPEYSPYAVAEHAMALLLTVNRKIHRAHMRVHELNFSLDGLVGFDLHGKTAGVLGTGRIGKSFAQILNGFGCRVLAFDLFPNASLASQGLIEYVGLDELLTQSDVISLHLPLTPETRHIIDDRAFTLMKRDALLINTSRGGLVDTQALINALKSHAIGGAGLDVYEEEEGVFFNNLSDDGIDDDLLARLLTFPNAVITSHQAFLTREALQNIAMTTLMNVSEFEKNRDLANQVSPDRQRS